MRAKHRIRLDRCKRWTTVTFQILLIALRCVIPVVCVANEREENVVKQHN